jgi:hypothetical protein
MKKELRKKRKEERKKKANRQISKERRKKVTYPACRSEWVMIPSRSNALCNLRHDSL